MACPSLGLQTRAYPECETYFIQPPLQNNVQALSPPRGHPPTPRLPLADQTAMAIIPNQLSILLWPFPRQLNTTGNPTVLKIIAWNSRFWKPIRSRGQSRGTMLHHHLLRHTDIKSTPATTWKRAANDRAKCQRAPTLE